MKLLFRKLRYAIGLMIGMPICSLDFFEKYKYYLLSSWRLKEKRKTLDNFLYKALMAYWIRFEYLAEKDPDKRESLKEISMGGAGGKEWARSYDEPINFESKIGRLLYAEACPLLPEIDKILSSIARSVVVIQVGSSSGKEIAWLAKKNPIHRYIGTDIYPEVIAYSSGSHNLPNLSFQLYSAKEIYNLLNKYKDEEVIIFSSASLQYVQPEHLEAFFSSIGRISNLDVLLLEPANELKGNPEKLNGSLWRGNFSYTHNYRLYAEKAGLYTKKFQIIRPYFPYNDFPMHNGTVHYFYWAKTDI